MGEECFSVPKKKLRLPEKKKGKNWGLVRWLKPGKEGRSYFRKRRKKAKGSLNCEGGF